MPSLANLDSYLGDDDTAPAEETEGCDVCLGTFPVSALAIDADHTRVCVACGIASSTTTRAAS